MEHAKRMVLVPEENLRHILLPPNFHSTVQTPGNASTRLDRQMSDVMSSDSFTNDREKWLEYQRILEQFLRSKNATTKSVTAKSGKDAKDDAEKKNSEKTPAENKSPLEIDGILQGVTKSYRGKSKALLEFMANTSNIRWDERGKVIIDDIILPRSNITDLVNDAARDTKRREAPNGRSQLSRALQRAGVPKKLIGSNNFWDAADTSLEHSRVLAASSQQREDGRSSSSSPLSSSSPQQQQAQKEGLSKWMTWR